MKTTIHNLSLASVTSPVKTIRLEAPALPRIIGDRDLLYVKYGDFDVSKPMVVHDDEKTAVTKKFRNSGDLKLRNGVCALVALRNSRWGR